MDSINFIKENLSKIYLSLPYLEIRYEYKQHINTHVVEVKPNYCYEKDNEYIDAQLELEDLFEEIFPEEEILFISENELIQVNNPIFTLGVLNNEILTADIDYDVVVPSTKLIFPKYGIDVYEMGDFLTNSFELPPPKKTKSKWWNLAPKTKKDSETNSGSFFLYKFAA